MYKSRASCCIPLSRCPSNQYESALLLSSGEIGGQNNPTAEVPVRDLTNSTNVFGDQLNHDSHPGRELAEANGEKLAIDSL